MPVHPLPRHACSLVRTPLLFSSDSKLKFFDSLGYPVVTYLNDNASDIRGINATGQLASIPGNWGLIDLDTPQDAYTYPDFLSGQPWQLIFSDEFNVEGRSFYPGDDPYWEAVDLHYWVTNNMEWYDPAAITTRNGSLEITLSRKETHDLHFQGGMMSTWNKFCFTGGMVLASIVLPGVNNVLGLWPALWTMGNLGRAGYGATLEGTVRLHIRHLMARPRMFILFTVSPAPS